MYRILFVLFIFSFASTTQAQSPVKVYDEHSIYFENNNYVKGYEKGKMGLFTQKLVRQFESEPAIALGEKAVKNRKIGFSLAMAALGTFVGGIIVADENERLGNTIMLGAGGLSIASLPISINANNQLFRATHLHNRNLLLQFE